MTTLVLVVPALAVLTGLGSSTPPESTRLAVSCLLVVLFGSFHGRPGLPASLAPTFAAVAALEATAALIEAAPDVSGLTSGALSVVLTAWFIRPVSPRTPSLLVATLVAAAAGLVGALVATLPVAGELTGASTLLPAVATITGMRRWWRERDTLILAGTWTSAVTVVGLLGVTTGADPTPGSDLLALALLPMVCGVLAADVARSRRSFPARVRLSLSGLAIAATLVAGGVIIHRAEAIGGGAGAATLGFLALLGGAYAFAAPTARRLSETARALLEGTRALASGQLDIRVVVEGEDEVTSIARAFNGMAERMTLQSQEMQILARVMKGTSDPVVVLRSDSRILFVNETFQERTGWRRGQAIGRRYGALLTPHENAEDWREIENCIAEGREWAGEIDIRSHDGDEFETFLTMTPVVIEGVTEYYVAIHHDLSTLRYLERERSAFNRNLLRIHGIAQSLVESLNVAEIRRRVVTALKDQFFLDARIWSLVEADDCDTCASAPACQNRKVCLRTGHDGAQGERLPLGVGLAGRVAVERTRALEVPTSGAGSDSGFRAAFPLLVKGELLGVLEVQGPEGEGGRLVESLQLLAQILAEAISNATLHERTRQQAAELTTLADELERSAGQQAGYASELEAANARLLKADGMKNQFLAATSHELRTPLASILGFLELILEDHADSYEEEREYLRDAHQCARHLEGIIEDVLDIARMEAGRIRIAPQCVDAEPLLEDVRSVSAVKAREKGLELELVAEEGARIHADYQRTKQILINLVGNAIKFTNSGSVRVTAKARPERGFVEFRIDDTGIGIPVEQQSRVFEAFVQAEGGDTRRYGGSGLGLTITLHLVSMMGGVIRIASEGLEKGTSVVFTLPIDRGPDRDLALDATADGSRPGVLIVDADPDPVRALGARLSEAGYAVRTVGTAQEAFDIAREWEPDWIITEAILPHEINASLKTGGDLLRAIMTSPQTRGIALLMLSGHELDDELVGLDLSGLDNVRRLTKPVDSAVVLGHLTGHHDAKDGGDRPTRVLFVDNEPRSELLIRRALGGRAFVVDFAANAQEALERIDAGFDVAVLNLVLPDLSGEDLVGRMQSAVEARDVPIVLLSAGSAMPTDPLEQELLASGRVAGRITKSSLADDPDAVLRCLRRARRIASVGV